MSDLDSSFEGTPSLGETPAQREARLAGLRGPDNPRMPLSQLPVQGKTTVMERPRQPAEQGNARPFAFAQDPRAGAWAINERTPLGALLFPVSIDQMRKMLERIGFMRVSEDDDIVAPPADDADEIRRDHVSAGPESWEAERDLMEPLLCQWLWNTMWTWIERRPGKAVRVDMVAILVDQSHEVTGRVQVSARMRISTALDARKPLPPNTTARDGYQRRGKTGALVDEE